MIETRSFLIFNLLFCRQKKEEKNQLIQKKSCIINDENKIQESINKEQVNLGRFQSEEQQNQNNVEQQYLKITDLSQEMQIDCELKIVCT